MPPLLSAPSAFPNTIVGQVPRQRTPLVSHIYTADPSAHVFDGRIYIYPSHDLDIPACENDSGDHFQMVDYHVLSLDGLDSPIVDHGPVLHVDDVPWAKCQMWAPDVAKKGDTYYFFFPARDKENRFRIGVASGSSPNGPFLPEPDPIEGAYSIDPCSFVDDDGASYLYFGGLWGGQLEKWQTGEFVPDAEGPANDAPAIGPRVAKLGEDMRTLAGDVLEIALVDERGDALLAGDTKRRYFEGPWMHKYRGKYYFSYSTGDTHLLVYAIGESPLGPFTYAGEILSPVLGWTTHHSILEFEDKWWLFYHDASLSGGITNKRCVKMMELSYDDQGFIRPLHP